MQNTPAVITLARGRPDMHPALQPANTCIEFSGWSRVPRMGIIDVNARGASVYKAPQA